ncbi:DUF5368 domain-containing protein [Actinobacillus genomosp. 1]|uniref:DUF5368 family protein n=1 Tax=Actinobacillus genomosp. 1 TaxID=254839 RepID=UPI0024432AE9|nr:DUF5368 family protein [Actinobacillus genomosp. 1]WGE34481.1 DUF5368 domain-containing protein [Actinobacillus genomosp. 1]WGE36528.1 DUF5368 domain-containing protein [Actinobacillus genomosp. 1]WGE91874.1 DUF5368 domain-containing protein [Actinobacillus genomosp. 1]
MNSLELTMLISVVQEMLAWAFYPLLILAVILTLALVILLVKEKGFHLKRLVQAEVVGFIGGFIGVFVLFWLTQSGLSDIGAPIDAFALLGTYAVNFVGFAVLYYTVKGWLFKHTE